MRLCSSNLTIFPQILAFLDFWPKGCRIFHYVAKLRNYLVIWLQFYLNDKLLMKKGAFIDFWAEMPRNFHNFNHFYLAFYAGIEDDSKFYII